MDMHDLRAKRKEILAVARTLKQMLAPYVQTLEAESTRKGNHHTTQHELRIDSEHLKKLGRCVDTTIDYFSHTAAMPKRPAGGQFHRTLNGEKPTPTKK